VPSTNGPHLNKLYLKHWTKHINNVMKIEGVIIEESNALRFIRFGLDLTEKYGIKIASCMSLVGTDFFGQGVPASSCLV
jgi:hypothetical protein